MENLGAYAGITILALMVFAYAFAFLTPDTWFDWCHEKGQGRWWWFVQDDKDDVGEDEKCDDRRGG